MFVREHSLIGIENVVSSILCSFVRLFFKERRGHRTERRRNLQKQTNVALFEENVEHHRQRAQGIQSDDGAETDSEDDEERKIESLAPRHVDLSGGSLSGAF